MSLTTHSDPLSHKYCLLFEFFHEKIMKKRIIQNNQKEKDTKQ